jgi:hypothetical protein
MTLSFEGFIKYLATFPRDKNQVFTLYGSHIYFWGPKERVLRCCIALKEDLHLGHLYFNIAALFHGALLYGAKNYEEIVRSIMEQRQFSIHTIIVN